MKRPKQVEVQCQVVDPEAKQLTSPEKIPKLESQVAPILLFAVPLPLPGLPSAPPPPPHGLQGESHVEDAKSHPKGGQDWEESKLNWDALRALCVPVTTPTRCHIQVHDHWEKGSTGGVLDKCREHLGGSSRKTVWKFSLAIRQLPLIGWFWQTHRQSGTQDVLSVLEIWKLSKIN